MKVLIIFVSLLLVLVTAKPEQCYHAPVYGKCNKSISLWAYYEADNTCATFSYSGCGGNLNRFKTEEECDDMCINSFNLDFY